MPNFTPIYSMRDVQYQYATDAIWAVWTTNTTNTSTAYDLDATWRTWTTATTGTLINSNVWNEWIIDPPTTNGRCPLTGQSRPDGVDLDTVFDWHDRDWVTQEIYDRRQLDRQRAADERRDREMREMAEAEQRAEGLLLSLLDRSARERYLRDGVVEVRVESGRLYELTKGWAGNVCELDPKTLRKKRRFCIHPRQSVPEADNVIAQMLLLQHDEDQFLKTANASVLV